MTTYTTPHFATGLSDRNVRTEPSLNRARPASAAPYRTAGVSNEAAMLADGPTPDWQPGAAKGGVPKAAIGALGAALVGGVALAIVLLAPSNKVVKQVMPDPVAQATAQNAAAQKSVDSSDAAVKEMDQNAPAVTPDVPAPAPVVTPPADIQPPAMQQTPEAPTVTPSVPTPAPTPDTPAPTPAPTPSE